MSISGALSSALSGLTASARAAEIVASNIANAKTEGYGRREIELSARVVGSQGQGVSVTGVTRHADRALISDRRLASAGAGDAGVRADFLKSLEAAIGTPETPGSLGARIAGLEAAVIGAAARPDSDARLATLADAAGFLSSGFADITDHIQTARAEADRRIATEVATVNEALKKVADLNRTIRAQSGGGRDISALMDQRQQAIDSIATIIPLREVPRDQGEVALFTTGGAVLLEGAAAELGFQAAGVIVPAMTLASGGLSGLTLNGKPIPVSAENGPVSGGSLAANFALRDDLAPKAQAQLDAVARDLVQRFADPAIDPTIPAGGAGLFTDAGGALGAPGLAGRLALNPAIDPAKGGALWRLRDGVGAAVPGATGQSRTLSAMQAAMTALRPTSSANIGTGARSLAGFASDLLSSVAGDRQTAESRATYQVARQAALREMELQGGVDTDQELQSLLVIEQSYAANARVIQTVDQMIRTLMEI